MKLVPVLSLNAIILKFLQVNFSWFETFFIWCFIHSIKRRQNAETHVFHVGLHHTSFLSVHHVLNCLLFAFEGLFLSSIPTFYATLYCIAKTEATVYVYCCWHTRLTIIVVFPNRGKILKTGVRVAEKKTGKLVFFACWNECDFERLKLNIIVKLLLLVPAQFISELLIKSSTVS